METPVPDSRLNGTRSIRRTLLVLKMVADRKEIGWRLTDLAAHCRLDNATTYRILACLADEGMVRQRSEDRRYIPGPTLYELSLCVPGYEVFKSALHPELVRIAAHLGVIAFLFLRSGDESVCIDRAGVSSVNPLTVVGTRRLMAESTGGIAILLSLPLSEQQRLIAAMEGRIHRSAPWRTEAYRAMLRRSRRHGYSLNRGDIVKGLAGIAFPLLDQHEAPFASIGVMGPTARFAGKSLTEMAGRLQQLTRSIQRQHAEAIVSLNHNPRPAD